MRKFLFAVFIWLACAPCWAALVTNGSAVNISTTASTVVCTLTTTGAGIVVMTVHGSNALVADPVVSSVAGAGLTWAIRGAPNTFGPGGFNSAFNTQVVYWAYSSSALAAQAITLTWTLPIADSTCVTFGVAGFTGTAFQTTPWDNNASLPNATNALTTTAPSGTGVSTTSTNSMLLAFVGSSNNGVNPLTTPAGGTYNSTGLTVGNGGGASGSMTNVGFLVVSSPQSGVAVTWGSSAAGWGSIVDALSENGNAGGGGTDAPMTLTGVGQ